MFASLLTLEHTTKITTPEKKNKKAISFHFESGTSEDVRN